MSAPIDVLWWELDQVAIALITCSLAFAMHSGMLTWGAVLLINYLYNRNKKDKPRGFLKHVIYIIGFIKLERYPEYFDQIFNE